MSERRKFIASLSNGGCAASTANVVPKDFHIGDALPKGTAGADGDRKAFLRSLNVSDAMVSAQAAGSSFSTQMITKVEFDLASILEFKGSQAISSSYKKAPEPPRLRPNYDNTKRKLYANPEIRVSQLRANYVKQFVFL